MTSTRVFLFSMLSSLAIVSTWSQHECLRRERVFAETRRGGRVASCGNRAAEASYLTGGRHTLEGSATHRRAATHGWDLLTITKTFLWANVETRDRLPDRFLLPEQCPSTLMPGPTTAARARNCRTAPPLLISTALVIDTRDKTED
ncbi:hypothetical protein BaRGS_00032076 [Batillaria attramentaria]|uniref:Secreted protein n=1 Tax=Batillaria attramentaria TaxID=370345 RepID=A0ABD0JNN3_9CAEN